MTLQIPRIAAIHDISCFGKCSLTTVLPILSAMGNEVCPIPTAVLSTHTGGFTNYSFCDMTSEMKKIIEHWIDLDIKFSCIYTGFLGSYEQIDIVIDFIKRFKKPDSLVLVDPVMADGGKLYSVISPKMALKMRDLVAYADIVTPNATEAALLTDSEYNNGIFSDLKVKTMLSKLTQLGAGNIVIKSLKNEQNEFYGAVHEGKSQTSKNIFFNHIEGAFHGAGDIFSSVLIAEMLSGRCLIEAVKSAATFVETAILKSQASSAETTPNSLQFETTLAELLLKRKLTSHIGNF